MKKKKKIKKILTAIITIAILLLIGGGIGYYVYSHRFVYNEEGVTGNTTGNLYNGGMFCVYEDYVYFANPDDNGKLYRMKEDGSELKRMGTDSVSYINIYNGYAYYVKDNMIGDITFVSKDLVNGISRLKLGEGKSTSIHQGISSALLLCGNDLYFRAYNEDTGAYYMRKANIDGKTDKEFSEEAYLMLDCDGEKIYFANVSGNHNLMYYNWKTEKESQCYAGNIYMPDCEGQYVYYIDLDNAHKLTRLNMRGLEKEVICDDYVINYNLNPDSGVIYYQAENTTEEHMLCSVSPDGSGRKVIMSGDYANINFTDDYVYCYKIINGEHILYRGKIGSDTLREFHPGKDD